MAALQAAFGGKRIWIPKTGGNLRCSICLHRDRCMRVWRGQGLAISRIARRLGVSPKTVYRVLGVRERARRARRGGAVAKLFLIHGTK